MRVLVACEFSGIVRDAFIARGHNAMSCDLLETEKPGPHYQGNVFDIIDDGWDLMIAHPPCTFLTISANKWYKIHPERYYPRLDAAKFFIDLALANIGKIAIENPIGVMSGFYRKPDQVLQPWKFGHGETKATCLWLKGLPLLKPTSIVDGREQRLHWLPPSPDRWKERSRTYQGIADAMANQWGTI
jgi:hypothetical protein